MAKVVLAVPEDSLEEFLKVLAYGLISAPNISQSTADGLNDWMLEQEEYLITLREE